jgi:FixJ family two-component response regulator
MDDHTQHVQPDQTPGIADNLSVTQENAIDLLVQGHNDRQVAEAIGVRRETVCNWRNHNLRFLVELSRRRRDLRRSHTNRLGHIATDLITT